MFPYFGWIILGWILTWAAVELNMLQRLLDTESITGGQWVVVIALSLVAPALVGIDKAIQLARQNKARDGTAPNRTHGPPLAFGSCAPGPAGLPQPDRRRR